MDLLALQAKFYSKIITWIFYRKNDKKFKSLFFVKTVSVKSTLL